MATVAAQFTPPFDNNELATTPNDDAPASAAPAASAGTLRASLRAGPQLRAFKASLQFLSKIGAELLVEAFPDRLVLRAINPSRSAFGAVTLRSGASSGGGTRRDSSSSFSSSGAFTSFDVFDAAVVRAGVPAKHLLAALRGGGSGGGGTGGGAGGAGAGGGANSSSSSSSSSRPARLSLELCPAEGVLRALVVSESLLVKRYELAISGDAEILHAAVDAAALPAGFVASPAGLNAALGAASFAGPGGGGGGGGGGGASGGGGGAAGGEVTVVITAGSNDSSPPVVELRSYADAAAAGGAAASSSAARAQPVRTTLRLDAAVALRDVRLPSPSSSSSSYSSSSSHSYAHSSTSNFVDVTLSARDLRAVLPLCESLGADAALRAAGPGAPVLVQAVPRADAAVTEGMLASVDVQLVLATLAESAIEAPAPAPPPQQAQQQQQQQQQQAQQQQRNTASAAAPRSSAAPAPFAPPPRRRAAATAPAANFEDDDGDDESFLGSMAAVDAAEAAAAAAKGRGVVVGGGGGATEEEEGDEADGVAGTPPDERPGW